MFASAKPSSASHPLQFGLGDLFRLTAVCSVLAALMPYLGIVPALLLMLFAGCLLTRRGVPALLLFPAAILTSASSSPAPALLVALATLVIAWAYRTRWRGFAFPRGAALSPAPSPPSAQAPGPYRPA